ncbi:MAG: hypothetical protein SGJ23_11715 [Alphaproteobacteria bacterium]|nr:hypothetical protein [Alphaproteobacteria bacterium]
MSETEDVHTLLASINAEVARASDRPVVIVSATFEWIKPAPDAGAATTHVTITRSTRTIVFSRGELKVGDTLVLSASAVHRVAEI